MTKKKAVRNEHIAKLYEKHSSLRAVAERVNLTHERIRQILNGMGISTAKKLDTPGDRNILIRD